MTGLVFANILMLPLTMTMLLFYKKLASNSILSGKHLRRKMCDLVGELFNDSAALYKGSPSPFHIPVHSASLLPPLSSQAWVLFAKGISRLA